MPLFLEFNYLHCIVALLECDVSFVTGCFYRCWKRISFRVLLEVCTFFWALSKPAQDTLLWSLQMADKGFDAASTSSSSERSTSSVAAQYTVKWFIAGVAVCRRAFLRMMGLGSARLDRTRKAFRGADQRNLVGKGGFFSFIVIDCFAYSRQ